MLVIFNPAAGSRRRRRLARAMAVLGEGAVLAETAGPGDARRLSERAAREGHDCVVAAGGDGTIAEVAAGLQGSGAALGILPFGTANVLALELGLPLTAEGAAEVIKAGREAMLRPGIAWHAGGERLFVQMLGAGLDAAVVQAVPPGLKRALGKGAYVWQTLRELARHRFPPLRFSADGGAWEEASGLIVTKGRLYAGRHLVAPGASPLEPGFTLVVQRRVGIGRALLAGAALPLNALHRLPFIELRRCAAVEIEGQGVLTQCDGDRGPALPLRIEEASHPLRVRLG
ncbi:diacylglycerol/lipid kinase family protein [Roseococcus pinisoli]|uniref:Diacylglycerol kinase family lipid kinase n=1 Tax=Roseococcus pinisoli TaxID=2835040 RepID=A0ABS5Q9F5_9PROT|nr:diacylglycerol kinase family protein [Roseococcus pinisoli]MBS7809831.1 diacylglycerol kinase family lipid kinase [Roseococcus pinisoli]